MASPQAIEAGLRYLRSCIILGVPYVRWNGVWPPNQKIFYARQAPPAPAAGRTRHRDRLLGGAQLLQPRRQRTTRVGHALVAREPYQRPTIRPEQEVPGRHNLGLPLREEQRRTRYHRI